MKNLLFKKMKTILMVICFGFLSFLLLPNVYAITDNGLSQYTSHKDQELGPIKFIVENYLGTCIDSGNPATESGTAKMTKIANDSDIAKAAYFFGLQLGYSVGLGADEGSQYYYESKSLEYLLQDLAGTLSENHTSGHERADALKASHPEWSSTTVPGNFEIFKGEPIDESQKFVVWRVNPFSAKKEYNCDTPSGLDHALVKNGDTIKYDITWENGTGTMTITDILSKGLSYIKGSATIGDPTVTKNSDGTTTLVWTTTETKGTLTYGVKVEANDPCDMGIDKVQNNATMTVDNKPYKLAELENPLPKKCYAPMPNDGYNHKKVKLGDDVKYQITLNNVKDKPVIATVTDILSKGLTYNNDATVSSGTITNVADPSVDGNKNTKIQFTISIPAKSKVELVYSAKVNSEASVKVLNNASVKYDNGRTIALNQLENPIYVPKKYIPTPDTGSNVAILGIASGIALVGVGGYFIYKKYKKA